MTERKTPGQMSLFGKTLNRIMVDHDVYTWQALRDELARVGYEVGQSQLSQYLYGTRNPQEPQRFFCALSEALGLSKDEEMRLTHAFGYPNDRSKACGVPSEPGLTAENESKLEDVRREKRERDEAALRERDSHDTGDRAT